MCFQFFLYLFFVYINETYKKLPILSGNNDLVDEATMLAIAKQLADQLPSDSIQLNCRVAKINRSSIILENRKNIEGRAVVVATDVTAMQKLLPDINHRNSRWRSVTNLYFSADSSPINEAIICLNGSVSGLVNNICVLSDAAPEYAPKGKSLLSVSVLGLPEEKREYGNQSLWIVHHNGPSAQNPGYAVG